MRVLILPIDMDEYLIAPRGSPAFTISDMLALCGGPTAASLIVIPRVNVRCMKCADRQLDSWDKLSDTQHPMSMYDAMSNTEGDPNADPRHKSLVNANCATYFYVHDAILDRSVPGCEHASFNKSCAYIAHMRALYSPRGRSYRFDPTDDWAAYIPRVQGVIDTMFKGQAGDG